MNSAAEQVLLEGILKQLRLPAALREYRECARQAREAGDSHEGFLLTLMSREAEQRQANQLQRRLKEARFPHMKTLEKTDLAKWPGIDTLTIRECAEGGYIERQENIVILGKHGTGKTHAAIALGIEACRRGHRVLFATVADLVNHLVEARDEKALQRTLKRLDRYALLILDELGYIPLSRQGSQLLFQVFARRYERGSLLVTSNLAFPDWTAVFEDENLTAALLDRLTHHCRIWEFGWESIRFMESLEEQTRKPSKAGNRAVAATAAPAEPQKEKDQDGTLNPS